jgi:hypothetical protein
MLRNYVIASLAAAHLALVAAGASRVNVGRLPVAGTALSQYASITGARAGYGFFAPEVAGQGGVEFEIVDAAGNKRTVPLGRESTREVEVRTNDLVEQFAGVYLSSAGSPESRFDPRTRRLWRDLAASLCGTVLGRHPEAREVVFRLRNYVPVSMAQYREGLRPHWQTLYEARFARRDAATSGGAT